MRDKDITIIPRDRIEASIYYMRGEKVMLDRDLAKLYGVTTGNLNKAVKRNIKRFPEEFMFQLSDKEFKNLKFQFGISSWGGTRKRPYAFTEQGIAMLSSVLNSERAIRVNIQIIQTFIRLRKLVATNKELREKVEQLEKKYDKKFRVVFEVLKQLLEEDEKPKRLIGFKEKRD